MSATRLATWTAAAATALEVFIAAYKTYVARQNARVGGGRTPLDPLPRVLALPGLGLIRPARAAHPTRCRPTA